MDNQTINNKLAKETWEEIGNWWDDHMEEGDIFHSYLVHPNIIKLLALTPNDNIIDLACGNGALTRKISQITQKPLHGLDFSSTLLERAKKRDQELGFKNYYELGDLMEVNSLQTYQGKNINKAVCSMAVHDIEDIQPLIKNVKALLPKGGSFVISTLHPCFNSGEVGLKETDSDKKLGIIRNSYIKSMRLLSFGKEAQPAPHPFFHRSLSELLEQFFQAGFVLDNCVEPIFSQDEINKIGKDFLWCKLPEIPPVILFRFVA